MLKMNKSLEVALSLTKFNLSLPSQKKWVFAKKIYIKYNANNKSVSKKRSQGNDREK